MKIPKIYKSIIKPILFKLPPENAHHLVFFLIKWTFRIPLIGRLVTYLQQIKHQKLERIVFGIKFPNPVGLAAGFDKNALLVDELACLGFGFIEIGTVTPILQRGNEKPRLFRLPKDKGLINRMGFNNHGMVTIAQRLKRRQSNIIVGGNLGKNKITPNDQALMDYEKCFHELYDCVDYFVINVSSPNTPNLRELQEKEPLEKLLHHVVYLDKKNSEQQGLKRKPVLLKIAPDLTNNQLDDIVEIVLRTGIDGIIATNTTLSRENLLTSQEEIDQIGMGGLSGAPLKDKSTEIIRYLHQKSEGKIPIIGVGGIHDPEGALEKLKAGASLIQLYTGFVYEGPSLIRDINLKILKEELSQL